MKPGSNKARKEASKRLGLKLYADYKNLATATGTDEIQAASITLGVTFNENIEFIINVLKHYGGMEVRFEPMTKPAIPPLPANDLPDITALVNSPVKADCVCPPLEAGIIGRNRHMTSCPQFNPAG